MFVYIKKKRNVKTSQDREYLKRYFSTQTCLVHVQSRALEQSFIQSRLKNLRSHGMALIDITLFGKL